MSTINVTLPDLPYAVEEALNRLRVNIKFCGKNTKKILIASSVENEGKTFVAIHLWHMLAEAGFPTVLVDTDLRKSVLKSRFQFQSDDEIKGLDYYLSGWAEYSDVVYKTNIKNGDIVPCTNLLENPSSLLEDARFGELFDKLTEDYRYVIIDSAPLDGAVLVVRSAETSRNLVKQSVTQLQRSGCKLLGMVLNMTSVTSRAYYKYYGKYGKEYYGGKHTNGNK